MVAHKGGAGKTTVAVNIAGALADLNRPVLLATSW
jgi:cellulose biosynthesis protein BcsQ